MSVLLAVFLCLAWAIPLFVCICFAWVFLLCVSLPTSVWRAVSSYVSVGLLLSCLGCLICVCLSSAVWPGFPLMFVTVLPGLSVSVFLFVGLSSSVLAGLSVSVFLFVCLSSSVLPGLSVSVFLFVCLPSSVLPRRPSIWKFAVFLTVRFSGCLLNVGCSLIWLSVCLSSCLPIHRRVCAVLFVSPFLLIYPPDCLFIFLSVCWSIC